ncbi:MAG TPA: Hg(II)-responsive transcriptional regulator [Thiobacillus sp.]|nr:MAG: Hg(II)-responsive transcriptional regulator [Hydrogenophilales bacterium 16-64-40]OZA34956.1 MAG: Hg(II)-responsive transcriptional regulator [Hydrogenophilales bacterium 17-64-65]HQS80937.1 Hg(II)-responsive transcriptional regulator [Thiobacillus sp.]HQT33447.1 Hg(II)-responsive transcriptional regulator [Thiobacillus sp.]
MQTFTISKLAQAVGVNVETIRFYQRRGLVAEPAKPLGGIRRYGEAEVARVLFVKSAQRIGFTLDEIAQLLQLDDGTQCKKARAIAEHKLADVRKRLQDLQRIEAALAQLVDRCASRRGQVSCPLIAALQPIPHAL